MQEHVMGMLHNISKRECANRCRCSHGSWNTEKGAGSRHVILDAAGSKDKTHTVLNTQPKQRNQLEFCLHRLSPQGCKQTVLMDKHLFGDLPM